MLLSQNTRVKFSKYLLNPTDRSVSTSDGRTVWLSVTEYPVLLDLLEAKGKGVAWRDFTPWRGMRTNPSRHPVCNHISALRKKLHYELIIGVPGYGYALAPGITVEVIPYSALSRAEVYEKAAEQHSDTHAGHDLLATIANCEDIIQMGKATVDTYLKLARACLNAGHDGFCLMHWREAVVKAKRAIAGAFSINPNAAPAYAVQGLLKLSYDFDWKGAEEDFQTALNFDENDSTTHVFYAHLLIARGDFEKGLEQVRIGVQLDPVDRITASTEPWMYYLSGKCDDAIAKGIEVTSLFSSFPQAKLFLGWAYQAAGDIDKAVDEYEKALDREFLTETVASLGNAYAQLKKYRQALSLLRRLQRAKADGKIAYVSPYNRAMLLAGFGDRKTKQCLDSLEHAFQQRCSWLIYMNVEPRFAFLRNQVRFKAIASRVGLPDQNPLDVIESSRVI